MRIEMLMPKIRARSAEDRKQLISLIVDTFTESDQPAMYVLHIHPHVLSSSRR